MRKGFFFFFFPPLFFLKIHLFFNHIEYEVGKTLLGTQIRTAALFTSPFSLFFFFFFLHTSQHARFARSKKEITIKRSATRSFVFCSLSFSLLK